MKLGIIGAGHIGGNIARRAGLAGYNVTVSFARDRSGLEALAAEIGGTAAEPADAAAADLVVLSVPWGVIDEALAQAGSLAGRVVVDTTNQFGPGGVLGLNGRTAARYNADRMPGAIYTKRFNTLTAGFQAAAATRTGDDRVVQWIAGDDSPAKATGYVAVDLAGIDDCTVMEAPRRAGAVYGEEYRKAEADAVVAAVRAGQPIPPPPVYQTGHSRARAGRQAGGLAAARWMEYENRVADGDLGAAGSGGRTRTGLAGVDCPPAVEQPGDLLEGAEHLGIAGRGTTLWPGRRESGRPRAAFRWHGLQRPAR